MKKNKDYRLQIIDQIIKIILNLPKNFGKLLIRFYQSFLSIDHSFWGKHTGVKVCIHTPSCSEYTYEAIDRFGLIQGSIMGFFRILRCNAWSKGGHDPVPERFSIKRSVSEEIENREVEGSKRPNGNNEI